jgi:hypothetical protein
MDLWAMAKFCEQLTFTATSTHLSARILLGIEQQAREQPRFGSDDIRKAQRACCHYVRQPLEGSSPANSNILTLQRMIPLHFACLITLWCTMPL